MPNAQIVWCHGYTSSHYSTANDSNNTIYHSTWSFGNHPTDLTVTDLTYLSAIYEDDTVGAQGHSGKKSEQLLECVPVSLGEQQTEKPQGISTTCRSGQLCEEEGVNMESWHSEA